MHRWFSAATRLVAVALLIAAGMATYVVKPGDTLSSIAAHFDVSVGEIIALNDLADPDLIQVGQHLSLPAEALPRGVAAAPIVANTHIVLPGESLRRIAVAHGTDVATLLAANNLPDGYLIAGNRIRLTPTAVPFSPTPAHVHTVKPGESLSVIAVDHHTTVGQLLVLNDIADPDRIVAGAEVVTGTGWRCPVSGATFARTWGLIKPDGRTHEGIDLFAPRGTPILAPVGGHIHHDDGEIGGLQFSLFGHDGVTYFGSHLDSLAKPGDVAAGDVIGTVGNTGNAHGTSTHLHFQVHPGRGQDTANPHATLVAACR